MYSSIRCGLVVFVASACLPSSSPATPITFTYDSTGSGSIIGLTTFNNAAFRVTATADTANRQQFAQGYFINHDSASIDIAGVGTFNITTATRTFVNNNNQIAGLSRAGAAGLDLLSSTNSAGFATWNMLNGIGPITGQGTLLQWGSSPNISTTGGTLFMDNGSPQATFTAVIPEPVSIAFIALGVSMRRRPVQ